MKEKEENDYKKYFNPKEYITHIVGGDTTKEDQPEKEDEIKLLTNLLTDPKHKDVKEETLLELKKEKKGDVLLLAIANQKDKKLLPLLIAACWESEINFSKYMPFFVLLALDDDYFISLEAMTVISTMEGPFDQVQIRDAIGKIKETQKKTTSEKLVLLNDLIDTLMGYVEK